MRDRENDFNLNISRYISTAVGEAEISLEATHGDLAEIEKAIATAKHKHDAFLKELGLSPLHKSVWLRYGRMTKAPPSHTG